MPFGLRSKEITQQFAGGLDVARGAGSEGSNDHRSGSPEDGRRCTSPNPTQLQPEVRARSGKASQASRGGRSRWGQG